MQTTALLDSSSRETVSPGQRAYFEWEASLTVPPLTAPDPLLVRKVKQSWELQTGRIEPHYSEAVGDDTPMGLLPVRNLRQDEFINIDPEIENYYISDFERSIIHLLKNPYLKKAFISQNVLKPSCSSGFKVSRYKSGETVGGFYTAGLSGKVLPPTRTGQLVTRRFTRSSMVKLRRSVECSETALNYFHTLTFAPSVLQRWHLNSDGTVRHDYAKWKLKKYLDALSQQQRRLGRSLSYAWVAELQKNGNVHFHILLDRFFGITWLTKIWSQSNNSVDIERVKNPLHAAQYMRKYITKDQESEIQGNRYFISQKLRDSMQPVNDALIVIRDSSGRDRPGVMADIRDFLFSSKTEIEVNGGVLLDFGFYVPMPRQSVRYRDKKTGEFVASKAVSPLISKKLFTALYQIADRPF